MAEPGGELFRLHGVSVDRGGRSVLRDIELHLPTEGPIVFAGTSGSGKSSLLRLLNRLDAPTTGTVSYRGQDLADLAPTVLRRKVAMVFQRPVVLEGTVADNLRQAEPTLGDDAIAAGLDRVGLDPALAVRAARDLSGGEAQRMCLARSLATDPEVVLFDEATSSLDPAHAARIEDLALGLGRQGITAIWVTHDLDQLRRMARHVVMVIAGRVAQAGTADEVLGHPTAEVAAFLQGDHP